MLQDRDSARKYFLQVWAKQSKGEALEPMERIVASVILNHPEYHALLEAGESVIQADFTPEMGQTNPFLHMGMHIAIQEQLSTDRPPGIVAAHQKLLIHFGEPHEVEHRMMECLGECLWLAQRNNTMPDEQQYLNQLKELI